jgi:hypothetical protein
MSNGDFGRAEWRKSSWSGGNGGQCVEVAVLPGTVGLRDSKDPAGPVLTATPAEFTAFVRAVARGALSGRPGRGE